MSSAVHSQLAAHDVQSLLDRSPFAAFLGLRLVALDHALQRLEIEMPWRAEVGRQGDGGQIHGGAIASLIDIAGDYAVAMLVGRAVPTIGLQVDYLRPAGAGALRACAQVRRLGRSMAVVDVEILDPFRKLVALGRATFSVPQA